MVRGMTPKEKVRRALASIGRTLPDPSVNSMRVTELSDDDLSEDEGDPEITTYEYAHIDAARTKERSRTRPLRENL